MANGVWLEYTAAGIELLAVVVVAGHILAGTVHYVYTAIRRAPDPSARYERYRIRLGRSLLLGLEILVAADVIRTVGFDHSPRGIALLGVLVVIRTVLSWSVAVEVDGCWPWQRGTNARGRVGTPLTRES